MAGYKFKFESILRIKEVLEKRIKEEISRIHSEINELEKQKEFLINERKKLFAELTEKMLKVSDYQSVKMYDSHLEKEIFNLDKKINDLYNQLQKKQNELIEKKKEVKSFEILKENDKENFMIEERRNELKNLNEIAIRNFDGEKL